MTEIDRESLAHALYEAWAVEQEHQIKRYYAPKTLPGPWDNLPLNEKAGWRRVADEALALLVGDRPSLSRAASEAKPPPPVSPCRRCSACEGMEHHWMPDTDGEGMPVMVCKHCPRRAEYFDDDDEHELEMCHHGKGFDEECERCELEDADENDDDGVDPMPMGGAHP